MSVSFLSITMRSASASYAAHVQKNRRKPFTTRLLNRLFLTLLSCLDCLPIVMDIAMRAIGPMLVATCWTIFNGMHYIYFWHIMPLLEVDYRSGKWLYITAVGIVIWALTFYNHVRAVFTSPGRVPDKLSDAALSEATHCKRCDKAKPMRAHHCSVCRRCTLRMCHHCPWIWNCVGFGNYRYFVRFMCWLWLGCIYMGVLSAIPLLKPLNQSTNQSNSHDTPLLLSVVLCLCGWCGLTGMIMLHAYFSTSNQTTIEYYANTKRMDEAKSVGEKWLNQYDCGSEQANIDWMLGKSSHIAYLLLPGGTKLIGDGTWFPVKREMSVQQLEEFV